jgi:hypothetical protein
MATAKRFLMAATKRSEDREEVVISGVYRLVQTWIIFCQSFDFGAHQQIMHCAKK